MELERQKGIKVCITRLFFLFAIILPVASMVIFLPKASNNGPPVTPPTKAAKGKILPIHDATDSVT